MRVSMILCMVCAATAAGAATNAAPDQADGLFALSEDVTVVTSERLTYDARRQYAVFEKDVVVTDPDVQLTAEKLVLLFDENGDPKSIRAEGNVHITHEDKRSVSDVATYELASGKFVLGGNPRVTRGKDVLQGDTITFWRGKNKLICEPQARLLIYPEQGDARGQFLGE